MRPAFAFLFDSPLAFLAEAPAARAGSADSAVLRLIRGIWRMDPDQARKRLRSPIWFTDPLNPLDWGAVKVSAKRMRLATHEEIEQRWMAMEESARRRITPFGRNLTSDGQSLGALVDPWSLVRELESRARITPERYRSDRPLGAVLVDREGRVLAAASNAGATARTEHAELLAIEEHYLRTGAPLPVGTRLYCSLKPCRMCAGALLQAAEDPARIRVEYRDFDPGPNARSTVLNRGSSDRVKCGSEFVSLPELEEQVSGAL